MFRDRTRLSSIHDAKVPRRSVLHERENRDGLRFSVRDAEGEEEKGEEEEEKAESHCFSCRGNPFVGALQSSVLIRPSTPSSLIVQLRLLHVRALVECLDFSTTLESTLQAAAESPPRPCTRTLQTPTISFPLTYTADPFVVRLCERIKPEQQTNREAITLFRWGGRCLDVAWREIVRAYTIACYTLRTTHVWRSISQPSNCCQNLWSRFSN